MERKTSPPPTRVRRKKKKLPGGEISTPTLPTPAAITAQKKELIACGKLSIGEPCSPYTITKSIVSLKSEEPTPPLNSTQNLNRYSQDTSGRVALAVMISRLLN